jgi:hypothetical protein
MQVATCIENVLFCTSMDLQITSEKYRTESLKNYENCFLVLVVLQTVIVK